MLFAALELERDPLQWAEMPLALKTWVQHAGMVAAFGLFIFCLAYLIQGGLRRQPLSRLGRSIMVLASLSGLAYLAIGVWASFFVAGSAEPPGRVLEPVVQTKPLFFSVGDALFFSAGLFAIFAVTLPIA